jgi:putative PIN family toxin of toxin-antitoxin system
MHTPIIILDTSVILTTFMNQVDSYATEIIKLAFKKEIIIVSTLDIFVELQQKIANPKLKNRPNFNSKKVSQFVAWYKYNAQFYSIENDLVVPISRDRSDDIFLLLAKYIHADYLISLDNDLLVLKYFYNTKIVTPGDFMKAYKG